MEAFLVERHHHLSHSHPSLIILLDYDFSLILGENERKKGKIRQSEAYRSRHRQRSTIVVKFFPSFLSFFEVLS